MIKTIRLILLMLSILYSYPSYGQSLLGMTLNPLKNKAAIEKDEVSADGMRQITGTNRALNIVKSEKYGSILVNLEASQRDSIFVFYLRFYVDNIDKPLYIADGSPILIKGNDGKVLNLNFAHGSEDKLGNVERWGSLILTRYIIYPRLELTNDVVTQLRSGGISKIRIELNGDICDIELKKDNISQFIYDEFLLLRNAIKTKRSFYDNF